MKTDNIKYLENSIRKDAGQRSVRNTLVALSGGADSVALALILKNIGMNIIALHCNFHLRGEESNRDMDFVGKFCEKYNIPVLIKEFDVDEFLENKKSLSLEMACRDLRYDWFKIILAEKHFDRIVTGHNADDNIETFFLNILRGAGTRGLRGMLIDNGTIWRPLLHFHRKEILDYLRACKQDFVVDSSNLKNDYRRNILRNEILPLIKKEWRGFDSSLDKTIKNIASENLIVESEISRSLPVDGTPLSTSTILSFPAPLLLIKRYIDPLGPFSTTPQEILAAIKANKPHIRFWKLKKGNVILRNRNLFIEMIHCESSS